jgi:hypothetical protein
LGGFESEDFAPPQAESHRQLNDKIRTKQSKALLDNRVGSVVFIVRLISQDRSPSSVGAERASSSSLVPLASTIYSEGILFRTCSRSF